MSTNEAIELADLSLTTANNGTQTCWFMALPNELLNDIIKMVVWTVATISWQGAYFNDGRAAVSRMAARLTRKKCICNGAKRYLPGTYNIASLLLVSRTLYNFTAPLFFSGNTFRFQSLSKGLPLAFQSTTFVTNLHHLSSSMPARRVSRRRIRKADEASSQRIEEISRLCPNLRTFVNHVPQVPTGGAAAAGGQVGFPWFHWGIGPNTYSNLMFLMLGCGVIAVLGWLVVHKAMQAG